VYPFFFEKCKNGLARHKLLKSAVMFCIEGLKLGTATIKVPDGLAIVSILLFAHIN
jgi:hypothetical protein